MTHTRGVGGSAAHDLRREGTVTPPEHNLKRKQGGGKAEEQLADPNRPHKSPSAREMRRAKERGDDAEQPADDDGA